MNKRNKRTAILIASDFDEEAVVHCLCQMRQRGTGVDLVGAPSSLINGASGLAVHPDYSLAHLNQASPTNGYGLLIIPGGSSCATALLADPRVHHAIKRTFANGGSIAAMSSIVPQIIANMGLLEPTNSGRFLMQGTQSITDFVRLLVGMNS
jgi:putative intracellular protease/amidase